MAKEPKVTQPEINTQLLLLSLMNNDPEVVVIPRTKKRYKIRWLKNGQLVKLTRLLLRKEDVEKPKKTTGSEVLDSILEDNKLACKAAAIIILDGFWKLKLFYWILWRWFYYFKQYDNIQLEPILNVGKKKVPLLQFYRTTMSLTEARDTLMQMRTAEVEATLLAQSMEQPSQTASSSNG